MSGVPQHLAAIAFAFILNVGLVKLKQFFKGVFFLPYITSTAAICMVFFIIFGQEYGLVNMFLHKLKDIGFLSLFGNFQLPIYFFRWQIEWFTLSVLIFWKWTGWNIIIYLAGLQTIPDEIYDAARIDGASWFQVFKDVTLPMIKPIIFFATSVTLIFGMQIFDEPMILFGMEFIQNNGFYALTTTAYTYLYAFRWGKLGLAASSSYALCLIIIIISNIYRKLMKDGEA